MSYKVELWGHKDAPTAEERQQEIDEVRQVLRAALAKLRELGHEKPGGTVQGQPLE
jgi:signal transduction histidine kinase